MIDFFLEFCRDLDHDISSSNDKFAMSLECEALPVRNKSSRNYFIVKFHIMSFTACDIGPEFSRWNANLD